MSVASALLPAPGGPIKVEVSFAASTPLMSHCFLPAWSHSRKYVSLSGCPFIDLLTAGASPWHAAGISAGGCQSSCGGAVSSAPWPFARSGVDGSIGNAGVFSAFAITSSTAPRVSASGSPCDCARSISRASMSSKSRSPHRMGCAKSLAVRLIASSLPRASVAALSASNTGRSGSAVAVNSAVSSGGSMASVMLGLRTGFRRRENHSRTSPP